ncbi:TniQ family protein [Thiomicrorhabdus indica]|uniref:TniQ family protein n=1 Tax=Thiomicrorhabdus indica TaxID=2267253 RepID=UPI002AA6FED8|nr:TniQ family protein [Thiomicrorhabdus indica]
MLLIKKQPIESSIGFIQRLCVVNAYDDAIAFLKDHFGIDFYPINLTKSPRYVLLRVSQNSDNSIKIFIEKASTKQYAFGKINLRNEHFSALKKWCPECLKESKQQNDDFIEHGAWEHIFVTCCPIHNRVLSQNKKVSYRHRLLDTTAIFNKNGFHIEESCVQCDCSSVEKPTELELKVSTLIFELYECGQISSVNLPSEFNGNHYEWLESIYSLIHISESRNFDIKLPKFEIARKELKEIRLLIKKYKNLFEDIHLYFLDFVQNHSSINIRHPSFKASKHAPIVASWAKSKLIRDHAPYIHSQFVSLKNNTKPQTFTQVPINHQSALEILNVNEKQFCALAKEYFCEECEYRNDFGERIYPNDIIQILSLSLTIGCENFKAKYGFSKRRFEILRNFDFFQILSEGLQPSEEIVVVNPHLFNSYYLDADLKSQLSNSYQYGVEIIEDDELNKILKNDIEYTFYWSETKMVFRLQQNQMRLLGYIDK